MQISLSSTKRVIAGLAVLGLSLATTSCAANSDSTSDANPETADKISIVTSTQIWADVVDTVTDDERVEIGAIVAGNDMDPHSFEPSAMDMAKAAEADIIVVGGGGYDSWLYSAVEEDKVVHAMELSTHDHDHADHAEDGHAEHADTGHADTEHDGDTESPAEDLPGHEGHDHAGHAHGAKGAEENEHVWYNTSALTQVAEDTAAAITKINPEITTDVAGAEAKIAALDERIHALPEAKVAQAHPIADHILAHTHMEDVTPEGYRATTLSHGEPTAADLAEFLELIASDDVDLLVDTPQTQTPYSMRVREAAEKKNIPVVEVNETPAQGENFYEFFDNTVKNFEDATSRIGHEE